MKKTIGKFFAFETRVINLSLQSGLLSGLVALTYVWLRPPTVDLIVMLLGIFIGALTHTTGLPGNPVRSLKFGALVAVTAAITTALGSACGFSLVATSIGLVLLIPIIGFSCGSDPLLATCVLFTVDMFIIGSGVAAAWPQALMYGVYFCAGGLLLSLVIWIASPRHSLQSQTALPSAQMRLNTIFDNNSEYRHFAFLLTIAVLIGNFISYHYQLPQGYWIPMTAMLILKSDLLASKKRISHRLYGTLAGSVLALVVIVFVTNQVLLSLLFIPVVALIVIAVASHYGAYTFFLTIMITIMLNLIHPDGYVITEHRVLDTLIGIIAVIVTLGIVRPFVIKFLTSAK